MASIKTKAEKKGDDWVINGSKMWMYVALSSFQVVTRGPASSLHI